MKIRLTILFLIATTISFAHSDFKASLNKENIYLGYVSGWTELEINNKFKILLELTDDLFIQTNQKRIPIYFSFSHDYTKIGDEYSTVAYDIFTYVDYSDLNINTIEVEGLVIKVRKEDLDIKSALNLIYAAVLNVKYIRANQDIVNYSSKYDGDFTFTSIPLEKIESFINEDFEEVKDVLKTKIYRNIEPENQFRNIDYFFQNNQYNFYNTREPDKEWDTKTKKYEISKSYGEIVLSLDNVFEIVGHYNYGHFIFQNDSTFYYLPQLKDKVFGPNVISGITDGRRPLRKPQSEYYPVKRFTLTIDGYGDSVQKLLYLPDRNLIIPNFNKLERQFVSELIQKTSNSSNEQKKDYFKSILIVLLLMSLVISLILIIKNKNSS